jgi:methyl-accepting chemotaxis protein
MKLKWNLRAKFLAPALSVIIIGMIIATVLSYRASQNALQDSIKAQMEQLTDGLSKQIDNWVADLVFDIEIAGSRDLLKNALLENNSEAIASANDALKKMHEEYGNYEFLGIANLEGITVASSVASYMGLDIGGRDYFQHATSGKTAISEVIKSKATGNPTFSIAVPIRQGNRTAGILYGAVDLPRFNEKFIDPVRLGQKGYAYMVDKEGRFLSQPEKSKILNATIHDYDWGKKVLAEKSGFMNYLWEGAEKIVSFESVAKTGWIVAAGAELDDIFAPVVGIRNQNILVAVIMVLAVGAVIFLIVNPIVKAVQTGVQFAEVIRAGDVSTRLNMTRSDEIGQLAEALDNMADGLEEKAKLAEQIADGNMNVDVRLASEKDKLGRALLNMTNNLNDVLGQVQMAGEQIASGSAQVSDSSQSLSQGATEQASSLEQITSSMTEMGSQTKQNAENATQANQLAAQARNDADKGNEQMKAMVTAMGEINESGQNISKIIKVIDEIAFQTNLLALNAAVEAARAGQHGKGFAVVAEEVRNLAARSAKAASETAELIEGSVKKAENGAQIADQTAGALGEIVAGITKVTDLVAEIAAASNEQAQGIGQVNQGLGQIDQVTQQNTANAEESAAASEELSAQANQLRQMLMRFKLKNQSQVASCTAKALGKAKAEDTSWGGGKTASAAQSWQSQEGKTQKMIALDDSEFGKY